MKALIIGVNGFVGQYMTEELLNNNIDVYGVDLQDKYIGINNKISYSKMNLLNKAEVHKTVQLIKPDYIINFAAISSVRKSWMIPDVTIDVNVKGIIILLEVIKELHINPRILLIGSSEEYAYNDNNKSLSENDKLDSSNPYGISKIAQEKLALIYNNVFNIDIVLIRAFNHTGPKQPQGFVIPDFAKQIVEIERMIKEPIIYVGNLQVKRDISDVRDIVKAYYLLLLYGRSGQIYNIGSGNSYCINDLLLYLISISKNKKIRIEIDTNKYRPTDVREIKCDNSKIKNEIGWEPKININKTIYDTLQYWRNLNND